jgi:site-specific DNA-methyltransferase (adenine-specific)
MQISQEQYNKLPERLQKHFGKGNTHPTIKNVKLMEYLIKMVTPKGGIVLDPFAGSGTTGVACINLNRNYILIEKEPEYIDIINKRLSSTLI